MGAARRGTSYGAFSRRLDRLGIVGDRPESGLRIDVARPLGGPPPWRYAGEAVTPSERFRIETCVEAGGSVTVKVEDGAPHGLTERVRLLVRAAVKHARDEGADPPRRIVRWRADG
jgi:hypothetical protein